MPNKKTINKRGVASRKEEQKLRQKLQKLFKKENIPLVQTHKHTHLNGNMEEHSKNLQHEQGKTSASKENVKKETKFTSKDQQKIFSEEIPKSQMKHANKRMAPLQKNNNYALPEKKSKQESMKLVVHSPVDNSSSSDAEFLPYLEEEIVSEYCSDLEEEEEELEYSLDFDEDSEYSLDFDGEDDDDYSLSTDEFSFDNSFLTLEEDDHIIHQGTAVKRALEPNDGEVEFDSDHYNMQIVELIPKEETKKKVLSECPQLVPIQETNGNKLKTKQHCVEDLTSNSSMMSDEYSEVIDSDDWSFVSEHISEKYENLDDLDDNSHNTKLAKMQADIIYAVGNTQFNIMNDETKENSSVNLQEELTPTCEMTKKLHISENSYAQVVMAKMEKETKKETVNKGKQQGNDNVTNSGTRMFNSINERYVLVLLKAPIYFYGTIRFKLIAGKIDVYGYKPPLNKEFELFSTRGCSCVSLIPIKSNINITTNNTMENILENLSKHYDEKTLNYLHDNYVNENDALVLLRRNDERAHMISHFKRHMNENVFPNIHASNKKNSMQSFEQQLDCYINESSTQALQMQLEWKNIPLLDQNAIMRLILTGGKTVGKSTLLRYLLNRLLNEQENEQNGVLVIDLDVGQGEIGLPQTISCTLMHKPLLGPGFFYKHKPDCSYLVGQINVTLCAQRYLHAVKLLLEHCITNPAYAKVPWLINSMGYNQGIGLELIAAICELLHPTDLVQIKSNLAINNFPCKLEATALRKLPRELLDYSVHTLNLDAELPKYEIPTYRLHTLNTAITQESRYQREWHMSAKDLRYANLLAQISDILSDEISYLIDRIPYCAALSDITVISLSDPYKNMEELHLALTANVVYLCQLMPENDAKTPMQCFGLGIVRSLDPQHIYIIPAAVLDNMNKVNCVVLSEQPLPTGNLKFQGSRVKNTFLPFVYATEKHASSAVKQIYHRPARFLSGKHKELLN